VAPPHLTISKQTQKNNDGGNEIVWNCCATGEPITGFDTGFENQFERWLVLSERISDIKGQPTERYCATFVQDGVLKNQSFISRENLSNLTKSGEGYLRLVLVRRPAPIGNDGSVNPATAPARPNPWHDLFASIQDPAQIAVMDDAPCGAPIVTSRVAVTFECSRG
jgi:hypothetical protein